MNVRRAIFTAIAACGFATGCGPTKADLAAREGVRDYLNGNFGRAVQTFEPLAGKTDENYVLNNLRLGASALANHDFDTAENAYFRAYQIMNAGKVNDAGREAATVWLTESAKVWRGEPYERAVANFQLGMIYYARGDWNNARGAFENALFKLRDYRDDKSRADEKQESDFAVALMMLGRVWTHLDRSDQAQPYFDRVRQLRPALAPLAAQLGDLSNNVVLYIEFGFGPRKVEDGMDGAQLAFLPSPSMAGEVPPPYVSVDGVPYALPVAVKDPPFDTIAMAGDRKWQRIDTIRATKSGIGTGLMIAGAGATIYGADRRDEGVALAGLGALAAGALLKASSAVDTRTWEMSPRTAFVIPLKVAPGKHDVTVRFPNGLYQTWRDLDVPGQGEATFYFRMMRWTNGEHAAPTQTADVR